MTDVLNIPELPDEDDTEGLRAYLTSGISAILNDPKLQLQPNVYMNLYTSVWRLTYREKSNESARSDVPYADVIYHDLVKMLADHVQLVLEKLQSQEDSLLFEAYLTEWDQYLMAANRIDRLLNLINRHWVKRDVDEGKPDVYRIRTLHFVQWRSYLWDKISIAVIDSAQLVLEKSHGNADKTHDMLKSFASLQIDYSARTGDARTRIRESLEAPFVPEIIAHERNLENIIAARHN
ncbi:uncharacterized protein FIESC28_05299 [Fusarium coffeatum]|uniref:Cullin N-terminal domain-containing protein n=1 Tax=Fusarium coffeatum TaxID=231269 RepID=A0A366RVG8_9HYPO|nr:uncharacterized protein FIESC28_05299 [Fusarium coffeatum]RBR20335.1 hypothetical protein FIESC28_05299 [Fusarium coffeatum]